MQRIVNVMAASGSEGLAILRLNFKFVPKGKRAVLAATTNF
jgi:hypothetical protein